MSDAHNPFDDVGPAEIAPVGSSSAATPAAPATAPVAAPAAPVPASATPVAPAPQAAVPAAPEAEANPFDAVGPAEVAPYQAPRSGIIPGAKAALLGAIPAAAGLAAAGPGAAAGAAVGALGGPLAPVTVPVGGFIGGLAGMMSASAVVDKAQDYAISKLPESWQEAGGLDEATRRADEEQHPTASFIGGLVPYAMTMRPGGFGRATLPQNATAIQRLMTNPTTSRLFGGAVQGGMELGQEKVEGQPADWQKVAIATAFGTVFNKPTRLGERLHSLGDGPFRPDVAPEAAPVFNAVATASPAQNIGATPHPEPGMLRFFHGSREGDDPASGGPRWVAPNATYARDFRSDGTPKTVHYFDATPDEVTQHGGWDEINGFPQNFEAPEQLAGRLKPYTFPPTVAEAADLKVMGPGITEDVYRGLQEQHPDAAMSAQETARQEAAVVGTPLPGPDLHDVARRMEPETFRRYDELSRQRDAFRATIAEGVNPSPDTIADAVAKRDAVQAQLDKIPTSGAGSDKAELRRLRAQVREAQRGVDAIQARRDAYAAGTAMDTPEVAQARAHLQAVDYEMRDLSPAVSAAYRRAADHAASETLNPVPLPAEPQPAAPNPASMTQMLADRGEVTPSSQQVPTAEAPAATLPDDVASSTPAASAPGAPIPGLDIAADIARQLIMAGRPEDEARAAGKLLAARYETRAARFKGALGSAEDVYRNTAPQMVGPDGRRIPGPPPRPADPLAANPTPKLVSSAPSAAEAVASSAPRAQRKHASLLEFLAQSGGIAPSGETHALFDRKSPFLPGIGALVRKDGMSLDKALRAAEEAGYLHDPGLDGSGARTLTPSDLLDAMAREHGGTKIYRPGDEPPAPRLTRAEQRAETERYVVDELRGHGIDAADLDKPVLDGVVDRVHKGEETDAHQAYEREVLQRHDQDERDREHRVADFGEIPGWDVPADAVPASATSGLLPRAGGGEAGRTDRDAAGGEAPRAAGELDREAAERASHAEHERWLDSLAADTDTLFQGANKTARGSITFRPGQRPLLRLMSDANASTAIHEAGHQFLEEMMADATHPAAPDDLRADAQAVREWLGSDGGALKTRQHEKFATGFEQYLREGRAPSPELAGVFSQFRDWLINLYRNLRGLGAPINDDIRGVFDRLISTEPNRTVIVPERSPEFGLGDVHSADAAMAEPHEAEGGMDRVQAEAARALIEAHPEHLSEIEAARNRIAAAREAERQQQAAGGAGTQPGGQAVEGAGGRDGLGGGGGGPDAVAGGGGAGASAAPERESGRDAGAEGDGLRSGERDQSAATGRNGAGRDAAGHPFAPRPAPWVGSDQPRLVDKAGNIRVENLTTRDDVAQAIHEAAAANGDFIGQRRGVITDGQVLDLADALGMTAEKLNRRKIGQAFNAEQIVAARKLLIESASGVADAMKAAATGTDEDVLRYAEAKDRHQMIQAQVAGITAEAGRALRAFRDLSGAGMSADAAQADLFVRQATGKTLFQLRQEAKLGAKMDTPQQVSKFMQDAQKPGFGRMLNEYFVNNLISGPVTHVTYGIGNTLLTSWKMAAEQPTAAAIGALRRWKDGGQDGVRVGEVLGQLRGAKTGVAPAVQAMLDAYRTGATSLLPGEAGQPQLPFQWNEHATPKELDEHATAFSIIKGLRDGIIAAGAMARDAGSDLATGARGGPAVGLHYDPTGAIPDVQVRGVTVLPLGTVARFPSRNVAAIHSFFRSMNYSIDKAGQAYRIAANEGRTGQDFASRVADVVTNPDEAVMERARGTSTDLTLMGQGGQFMNNLSKWLSTEVNLPGLGPTQPLRFVDPFVKIAGNVMNQSLLQRTPLGLLAPEMRADLAGKNGAAAQDLAAGRMLAGTALSVAFGTLAAQGAITGSGPVGKDAEETRNKQAMWKLAGNQAHSVRIGDTWYDLHRLGPLGMLMGVAADMHDVAHLASDGDLTSAASALQQAIAQNVLDESFMKGPADLMKAIDEPGRYGEGYVKNFLTSFVPYSVAMAQMDRASDPYTRQARTIMDGIKAKVPGLSEELFPKRDVWGMPIDNKNSAISPYVTAMYAQKADTDPLAKAMYDIGVWPAPVERKIRGVDLTDAQYDDFARIAGATTRQRLAAMVRMPEWNQFPEHVRADIAKAQIKGSREAAMGLMQAKYPSIPAAAAAVQKAKALGEPKLKGQPGA